MLKSCGLFALFETVRQVSAGEIAYGLHAFVLNKMSQTERRGNGVMRGNGRKDEEGSWKG